MEYGELSSPAERLAIRYGPDAFGLTQLMARTVARVELLAPPAWEQVADTLDVGNHCSRCGIRFWFLYPVGGSKEGRRKLRNSTLFAAQPTWEKLFGPLEEMATFTGISHDPLGRTLRTALTTVQHQGNISMLAQEFKELTPEHAILLDLDFVLFDKGPKKLTKAGLKDFIRASWERGRSISEQVREHLT